MEIPIAQCELWKPSLDHRVEKPFSVSFLSPLMDYPQVEPPVCKLGFLGGPRSDIEYKVHRSRDLTRNLLLLSFNVV